MKKSALLIVFIIQLLIITVLIMDYNDLLPSYTQSICDSNGHEIIEGLKVSSSSAFLSKKLQCHTLKLVFEEGEKVIVANSESMTLGNGESEESKCIWFDEIYNNKKIKAVVFNGKYFQI